MSGAQVSSQAHEGSGEELLASASSGRTHGRHASYAARGGGQYDYARAADLAALSPTRFLPVHSQSSGKHLSIPEGRTGYQLPHDRLPSDRVRLRDHSGGFVRSADYPPVRSPADAHDGYFRFRHGCGVLVSRSSGAGQRRELRASRPIGGVHPNHRVLYARRRARGKNGSCV